MEELSFTPKEFKPIDEFEIPIAIEHNIQKGNYEDLYNILIQFSSDQSLNEEKRLEAAYFAIKLNRNFQYKKIEIGSADLLPENTNKDDYYLSHLSKEQKESQKNAVKYLKKLSVKDLQAEIFNFSLNKFPELKKGFDRSLYSSAKSKYWNSIGLIDQWEIPDKIRENIYEAESLARDLIEINFKEIEEENWQKWAKEYQSWLKQKDLIKVTKANIKEYFKESKIKASNTTVDRIKKHLLEDER